MTHDLITVTPDTEITRVVQILIEHDISGLLVVSNDGELLGILTERDCLAAATSAGYYDEWAGPASQYMSTPVQTVASNENLIDVATRMIGSPHRRFPVLEHDRLVGLISRRDVLRALGTGSWFSKPM